MAEKSETVSRPGISRGILDISRYKYLLDLLVQKEVRVRYRGSWLGMAWTYVKPLTQFIVFYVAMGIFLGLGRGGGIENYPVYLFAGIIVTNFFNEAFMSTTMSIVGNAGLIKKIYLPRELFPLASLRVSFVHFLPQWLVLMVGSILLGWKADLAGLVVAFLAFVSLSIFAFGMGLFFGSINVFYRDAQNATELVSMIAMWLAPSFYTWHQVASQLPHWGLQIYMANPIAIAVEAFHRGFWWGSTDGSFTFASGWGLSISLSFVISLLMLAIGEFTFRKLEGGFAQEM
ncbi:ABC transporter permease [Alloscardovia macacae]|uniref:Transport permease protein n=1 Tax=Alloscardovia macacae TaxID=1160091 RepID=A0A261F794_9BIFI|nr:ABC transporter permease [Alloscardovia macacae]OZG54903.1 sugar ABC transporter permease [Alloscardovia macacae]